MLCCIVCCSQVVAPKKVKLAEAEASLAVQMEKLNAKRTELQGVSPHSCIVEDRVDRYGMYKLLQVSVCPYQSIGPILEGQRVHIFVTAVYVCIYFVHDSYTPFQVVMAKCAVLCVTSYCCTVSEVFFT